MNINVNIDIQNILNSIDIKELEQYIRKRKIEEIQTPGSVTKSSSTTIPLNLTNKILLNNSRIEDDDDCCDLFDDCSVDEDDDCDFF